MQDISKIMCVIDLDAEAQPALQRGAWLAKSLDAELELLISYYNEYLSDGRLGSYPSLENAQEDILEGLKRRLESLAEPLRESGLVVNTTSTWDHPLYEGIIRHAIACDADVVFMQRIDGGNENRLVRNILWFDQPQRHRAGPNQVPVGVGQQCA